MKNFFKKLLNAFCYIFTGCGCLTIICIVFICWLFSFFISKFSDDINTSVSLWFGSKMAQEGASKAMSEFNAEGGFLLIDLSMPIIDSANPEGASFFNLLKAPNTCNAYALSKRIKAAKEHKKVKGIVLVGSFNGSFTGFSQIASLRKSLESFKESGKKVYAYLENASQADYYLASVADFIALNPAGVLELKGISLEGVFLGNALKKYGISAQLIRAGKYKSAGETFISDKMSAESKEVYSEIANELWKNILKEISKSKNIDVKELQNIADNKAVLTADDALSSKLVNELMHKDLFITKMTELAGEDKKQSSFKQISVLDYYEAAPICKKEIAVLYLNGEIIDGETYKEGFVTSDYYAKIIRKLKKNPNVEAVVLRIDSPGGSAYASEQIRRELELLAKEKTVLASFSSTAASGGYWISLAANKILAEESTLTGSIGVFGLMFSFKDIARNFGVTFDGVKTSELANIDSGTKPLSEKEIAIIQTHIDKIYTQFIDLVAESRGIEKSKVEEIAQGKVWLASLAKNTGLFDGFGNLTDAIELASSLSGSAKNLSVNEYPKRTFNDVLDEFFGVEASPFAKIKFFAPKEVSKKLDCLENKEIVRAQMPYSLEVE